MEIDKEYQKRIEDIAVEGEDFANSAMKDVYLEQKDALDELHKMIGKMYIDYAQDGFLNLDLEQKSKITDDIKTHLKEMGIRLAESEVSVVSGVLASVFATTYYKSAYTLESGMKTNIKFNILRPEFIDKAVQTKFKDEMFSDRIWANKADMIDELQSSIIDAMHGNVSIDKVGRNIRDTFNVSAYESRRLVNTETARIKSQAQEQIGLDSGVKQVIFSATLDAKTCSECASLDGNVYNIDDPNKPEIPLHPNCRSYYINVPYAGWSPTQRRENIKNKDGKKEVIDYTNYASWAKDKGIL